MPKDKNTTLFAELIAEPRSIGLMSLTRLGDSTRIWRKLNHKNLSRSRSPKKSKGYDKPIYSTHSVL